MLPPGGNAPIYQGGPPAGGSINYSLHDPNAPPAYNPGMPPAAYNPG